METISNVRNINKMSGIIDPTPVNDIVCKELKDIIIKKFDGDLIKNSYLQRIPNIKYDSVFYTNNFEMFKHKYCVLRNKPNTIVLNTTVPCGTVDCYRVDEPQPIEVLIVDTHYEEFDVIYHKVALFIYEKKVIMC